MRFALDNPNISETRVRWCSDGEEYSPFWGEKDLMYAINYVKPFESKYKIKSDRVLLKIRILK